MPSGRRTGEGGWLLGSSRRHPLRPPRPPCTHPMPAAPGLSLPLQGAPLSAMHVKDSDGRWQDVQLARNEVAVCCGATLQHATAGLLHPRPHRVVGQPFSDSPERHRRLLHFELRPRPDAVLDLRPQLEAAGHTVGARWDERRGLQAGVGGGVD